MLIAGVVTKSLVGINLASATSLSIVRPTNQ